MLSVRCSTLVYFPAMQETSCCSLILQQEITFFICVLSGKMQGILQTTIGRISDFEMAFRQILPAVLIHNRQQQLFLRINQEGWPRAALPAKFSNRAVGTGFGPVHQCAHAITVALCSTLESRSFYWTKLVKQNPMPKSSNRARDFCFRL